MVGDQGDFAWAVSLLQEAARKLPDQAAVLYDFAWASYRVGRVAEAETAMQAALSQQAKAGSQTAPLTPAQMDDAKSFLQLVAAAKDPTSAQAAAGQAQKVLASQPDCIPALMVSAQAHDRQADYPGAKLIYEKILAADPLFAPATRQLALLYTALGDNQKGYALATKAREAFPNDAEIARTLGILSCHRAEYRRAIQLLKESAQTRSEDAELLYYLGLAHYQIKDRAASKAALQHALALNLAPTLAADARKMLAQLNSAK